MKNFIEIPVLGDDDQIILHLINLQNVQSIVDVEGKAAFLFTNGDIVRILSEASYEEVKKMLSE